MARSPEVFEIRDATRDGGTAIIVGLSGPPGGGKTWSALRIASGMQRVRGGPVVLIDTDNERAKAYADDFQFKHLVLRPPFRSTRFMDAVRQANGLKPAAIIVDSISDEHEGEGGILDFKEAEIDRMLGDAADNWARREAMNQRGWIRPKAERLAMIRAFMQLEHKTPLILCFRSREKTAIRPKADDPKKTEIVKIGWQPIAPKEIVDNCSVVCLLRPRSDGVPTWKSGINEEDFVIKLPAYAKPIFGAPGPLSEAHGEALARWALGERAAPKPGAKTDKGAAAQSFEARALTAVQALHAAGNLEKLEKIYSATGPLRDDLFAANEDGLLQTIKDAERERRLALKGEA
jgi:hypothetical protein